MPVTEPGEGARLTVEGGQLACTCGHVFLGAAQTPADAITLAGEISAHWIREHGEWLIRCTGVRQGARAPFTPAGQYLEDYRPEAVGGYGMTGWTHDPGRAMRFASMAAARAAWSTPSAVMTARHPAAMYAIEVIPAVFAELDTGPAEPGTTHEG